MGRAPCCDKANVKKGPWSPEEDATLKAYIEEHGTGGNWIALPQKIGLKRCGKSCRLRWLNYLRPNIKHGGFSEEEDNIICSLYVSIGSRWSIIAAQLPGRTDNDIKNYWNTRLKKKLLGRQRKEQQARRASLKQQEAKISETQSNFMAAPPPAGGVVINHHQQATHYWPELPSIMPPAATVMNNNNNPNQFDDNHFMDQEAIRNLLIKLGGRFSEETRQHQQDQPSFITTSYPPPIGPYSSPDQIYASSTSMLSSPATITSIDSSNYSTSVNGGGPMMFQGIESYPVELEELVYGNNNPRGLEGQQLEGLYGVEQMGNVSSNGGGGCSTSAESGSWGNISPLVVYPQIVSEYETTYLQQSMPQDSPFEGSSYYYGPH